MADWYKSKFDRKNDVYSSMLEHFWLFTGNSQGFMIASMITYWAQFHTHTVLQPSITGRILQLGNQAGQGRFDGDHVDLHESCRSKGKMIRTRSMFGKYANPIQKSSLEYIYKTFLTGTKTTII